MIKKILLVFILFLVSLGFLHQKVSLFTEAYKLSENYHEHNKLIDSRDDLLYNFSGKVSLKRINYWVESNGFELAKSNAVLALDINDKKTSLENKESGSKISSFAKIFRLSGISKVLAQEQR